MKKEEFLSFVQGIFVRKEFGGDFETFRTFAPMTFDGDG